MNTGWGSRKDRALRFVKLSAKKKLELLRQMNEFLEAFSTKKTRYIRRKIRESREI